LRKKIMKRVETAPQVNGKAATYLMRGKEDD